MRQCKNCSCFANKKNPACCALIHVHTHPVLLVLHWFGLIRPTFMVLSPSKTALKKKKKLVKISYPRHIKYLTSINIFPLTDFFLFVEYFLLYSFWKLRLKSPAEAHKRGLFLVHEEKDQLLSKWSFLRNMFGRALAKCTLIWTCPLSESLSDCTTFKCQKSIKWQIIMQGNHANYKPKYFPFWETKTKCSHQLLESKFYIYIYL